MLAENAEGNLIAKQVKFAETIHSSGTDLLSLINDILDLSKIESGTMAVEVGDVRLGELRGLRQPQLPPRGRRQGSGVHDRPRPGSAATRSSTDVKRLQQVLKNLLSNALKFTEHGSVALRMEPVAAGWSPTIPMLDRAEIA